MLALVHDVLLRQLQQRGGAEGGAHREEGEGGGLVWLAVLAREGAHPPPDVQPLQKCKNDFQR